MKILIVGQWFVSVDNGKTIIPGGTERYVYGVAKQLQSDGYDIIVISMTTDKDKIGYTVLEGLNVYTYYVPKIYYGYLVDIIFFINILKFIRRFKPDIVHVISSRYRSAVGVVAASKILCKKTIFTLTLGSSGARGRLLPHFLDNTIFKKILQRTDIIIILSNEMKKDLLGEFPLEKIVKIPSFFTQSYYRKNLKEKNSIVFIGRLETKHKGIDLLIKSLTYIREIFPEIKLHIIGKGSSLDYLVQLVSDHGLENNVIFYGNVEDSKLVEIYSRSEVFVLPSLYEGMPMVLLEAMNAGIPIVAFDIDPVVEALDNGKYGILVKKGDVEGLADAIIKLLKNDELKEYYSRMSLERSEDYSQEVVVRKIENLYSNLITSHK